MTGRRIALYARVSTAAQSVAPQLDVLHEYAARKSLELDALGVDLVVLDQGIDTTTPAGRFLFHTLAAVAEFERDLIRDRTLAGVAAAKKRGIHCGRPAALDAEQARRAARLHRSGASLREIAELLGVSKTTVAREARRAGTA